MPDDFVAGKRIERLRIPESVRRRMAEQRAVAVEKRSKQRLPPTPVPMLTIPACVELASSFGYTHLKRGWFEKQIAKGVFPSVKVGSRRMVRRDVVEGFLATWSELAL